VCEAENEKGNCWEESVDFRDWEKDEESLESCTNEEKGAKGEIAAKSLMYG
jgi:hypothetical protein